MHCHYDSSRAPHIHKDTSNTRNCAFRRCANSPQLWLWNVIAASASTVTTKEHEHEYTLLSQKQFVIQLIIVRRRCAMVRALDSWSRDRQVHSQPVHFHAVTPSNLSTHVTKRYNLVLAKGQWCSAARKVTVGLAESNDSLLPGRVKWVCRI